MAVVHHLEPIAAIPLGAEAALAPIAMRSQHIPVIELIQVPFHTPELPLCFDIAATSRIRLAVCFHVLFLIHFFF